MSAARLYTVEARARVYVVASSAEEAERVALCLVRGELDADIADDAVDASPTMRDEVPREHLEVIPWDAPTLGRVSGSSLDADELDQCVEWWLARGVQ